MLDALDMLEPLFSMVFMFQTDKGSSLNLDLMISGNCVVIMIMLMSIYVYMYVCMSLYYKVVRDQDCFMIMCICISIYIYMSLFDKVFTGHSCGGMISYASEWHGEVPSIIWNQVGKFTLTNLQG